MSNNSLKFAFSNEREPHRDRTKQLLISHPELRQHIGKNPYTFLIILTCIALQLGVGGLLRGASWWAILPAAFFFGAYVSHALWTLIHECSHNLIFGKRYWNTLAGIGGQPASHFSQCGLVSALSHETPCVSGRL